MKLFSHATSTVFMLLYADDAVIFAKSKETLQKMLHDLRVYCDRLDLTVNTVKSMLMVFEKGRATHPVVIYGNTQLDIVASFKYLGIEFIKNGNWYRTQKKLSVHASFALHKLYLILEKVNLPVHDMCKLFDHWLVRYYLILSRYGDIMKQNM
jgi:hypothetical protein